MLGNRYGSSAIDKLCMPTFCSLQIRFLCLTEEFLLQIQVRHVEHYALLLLRVWREARLVRPRQVQPVQHHRQGQHEELVKERMAK